MRSHLRTGEMRYFWDYCASVNIVLTRPTAKSNSRGQGKSSKGVELQQGTFALKIKVELAKIVAKNS